MSTCRKAGVTFFVIKTIHSQLYNYSIVTTIKAWGLNEMKAGASVIQQNTESVLKPLFSFSMIHHFSIQDRYEDGEARWQTLGQVNNVVIILVAHTVRIKKNDEITRIISARKAT